MYTQDQIKGTLLGTAWGDVLGCPLEGWTESQIMTVYGNYKGLPKSYNKSRIQDLGPNYVKRLRPLGLYSDDTQQALAILNICINGGWSAEAWAKLLVAGKSNAIWRGYGKFFMNAVDNLSKGKEYTDSGSFSAGIGSAMRIAPVGGLYHGDLGMLEKVVVESSLVTHADVRATSFAYAVALTCALYIQGKTAKEIRTTLVDSIRTIEDKLLNNYVNWNIDKTDAHAVSQGLEHVFTNFEKDIPTLRRRITEYAGQKLNRKNPHPNDGFVLLGGLHALSIGLLDEANPKDVLLDVIRLGDDTDTVGAILGGIFGARFGTDWMSLNGVIDHGRLINYAEALVTKKNIESERGFINREHMHTLNERNFKA